MLSEDLKILRFNQYQKSDKTLFVIYSDLQCLIKTTDGCKNNPGNSFTTKVGENIGFSISAISSVRNIEDKYEVKIVSKRFVNV